jgi:hypothetical protein
MPSRSSALGALLALFFLEACASTYSLKPTNKKPELLNGIPLETLVLPKCVLQAGFQTALAEEILVRVKVTNKSDQAFELDPTVFTLVANPEVLKNSPVRAANPDVYLKDLTASAEILESRAQMGTYQGIEALGTFKAGGSDREIESARDQYATQRKEADLAQENARTARERIAVIQANGLRKATVKAGESLEGALVFKATFLDDGPVAVESEDPICGGTLRFTAED